MIWRSCYFSVIYLHQCWLKYTLPLNIFIQMYHLLGKTVVKIPRICKIILQRFGFLDTDGLLNIQTAHSQENNGSNLDYKTKEGDTTITAAFVASSNYPMYPWGETWNCVSQRLSNNPTLFYMTHLHFQVIEKKALTLRHLQLFHVQEFTFCIRA